MTPRSKHVFILVLFVIVLLAGLLFAQRAGGKRTVQGDQTRVVGQTALLVATEPIDVRLEKADEHSSVQSREELVNQLRK